MNKSFVFGVATGCLGIWAYHKWVRPMPTSATK